MRPAMSSNLKSQLPAMRLKDIQSCMKSWKQPMYRAKQIIEWCNKGVLDPHQMRTLPIPLQNRLAEEILCMPLTKKQMLESKDGTRKYLFNTMQNRLAESVFIPETTRGTICISSQDGCVFDCPFCHTGTLPFKGNLSCGEITSQVLMIKQDLRDNPAHNKLCGVVTHLVYMGMGEPLANEEALHASIAVFLDKHGLNISRRRITVSTSGVVPAIQRLGDAFGVNLAISLHAATDKLRNTLVPINQKYPLHELRQALDAYPLPKQRHITLEYVMLAGINDRDEDIQALRAFVNPEREKLNLICFNSFEGNTYKSSSPEHIDHFSQSLIKHGIRSTVRRSRGSDIMAACGQLAGQTHV